MLRDLFEEDMRRLGMGSQVKFEDSAAPSGGGPPYYTNETCQLFLVWKHKHKEAEDRIEECNKIIKAYGQKIEAAHGVLDDFKRRSEDGPAEHKIGWTNKEWRNCYKTAAKKLELALTSWDFFS